jgi:uncharacterized RDD family membrane protein YckC
MPRTTNCPQCNTPSDDTSRFCTGCGGRLTTVNTLDTGASAPEYPGMPSPAYSTGSGSANLPLAGFGTVYAVSGPLIADKGARALGYVIDVLPCFLFAVINVLPIIGTMIYGAILTAYWLLRDVAGTSLGKLILGNRVASKKGCDSSVGQRLARNLPLVIAPILLIIPVIGMVLGPSVAIVVIVAEVILILSKGERLGDMMAGTVVVKKRNVTP